MLFYLLEDLKNMELYKFQNKNERKKLIWLSLVTSVFVFIVFADINIGVNKYLLFFIASIFSYINITRYVKKSSKTFEEIIMKDDVFKLYVFDKRKKPIELSKTNVMIKVEAEKISFQKHSGELIGEAYKQMMEEPNKWDLLVKQLKEE